MLHEGYEDSCGEINECVARETSARASRTRGGNESREEGNRVNDALVRLQSRHSVFK